MSHPSHRWLTALGAAALLVPAAAAAKRGPDHPGGKGGPPSWAGGPPPWVGGPPPWAGGGEAEAPVADEPAGGSTVGALDEPAPTEPAPDGDATLAPAPVELPRAPKAANKGRRGPKAAMYVMRGVAAEPVDGVVSVLVSGGNRRGREFKDLTVTVEAPHAVIDDERAPIADVREGDEVLFHVRLPRGTVAEPMAFVARRLIVLTSHVVEEEPLPTDPGTVEAPAESVAGA